MKVLLILDSINLTAFQGSYQYKINVNDSSLLKHQTGGLEEFVGGHTVTGHTLFTTTLGHTWWKAFHCLSFSE